ncbi:hypothetical protein LS482_07660 [Sinomicrobium kalidii]|uniref:hypothetical protein n=1 Tax=Sinomicrobium kalidii TaxID=2900738 RepID=UPI001E47989E|nr:hypothetical protein [Sinomicrobium kalidii]UGU17744.1 hypothetical protein LS482_07660 [Sinomicrobium kalidii]
MGIIQTLHSYWAYLTLLMLIIAVVNAITGYFSSKPFIMGKDLRISLFALIFTHIQLLLGIILYFVSERFSLWSELGAGGVMKNDLARLLLVEHPFTNILAIILITIGWSKHKKVDSAKGKFGKIAFFYTLGLILLLSRIPWGQWM